MGRKKKEQKISISDIIDEINGFEKYVKMKESMNEDFKKHLQAYIKQGMAVQKKYIQDINEIVKLDNIEQCENFIKQISSDIPKFATMEETNQFLNELVKSLDDGKEKPTYDFRDSEFINKELPTELREKVFKLQDEDQRLDGELKTNFQTMTEMVYPLHRLSTEKMNFLWNLTSWKFNSLTTKQLNNYTKAIMLLTALVVILTIVTAIEFFLK